MVESFLPADKFNGTLLGRVWVPAEQTGSHAGPSPILVTAEGVFDLSAIAPTCGDLLNGRFNLTNLDITQLPNLGSYDTIMTNTMEKVREEKRPYFLSPISSVGTGDAVGILSISSWNNPEPEMDTNHQYPDGLALFTGTLFAPTQDRDAAGMGFTHKVGDVVRIQSRKLGILQNHVAYCEQTPPWAFGISALMHNLSKRGLLTL